MGTDRLRGACRVAPTSRDSFSECGAKTLDRTVDRRIRVWSAHSCAEGARGLQRNAHRAGHGTAPPGAIFLTEQNPGTTEVLTMARQGSKDAVLGVGARLSVNCLVSDDSNAVHPRTESQGLGHGRRREGSEYPARTMTHLTLQSATSGLQPEMSRGLSTAREGDWIPVPRPPYLARHAGECDPRRDRLRCPVRGLWRAGRG
jgi:hypothetical protein